jgi:hypothetical protein
MVDSGCGLGGILAKSLGIRESVIFDGRFSVPQGRLYVLVYVLAGDVFHVKSAVVVVL